MFPLHLESKGCMAWEDKNLIATGSEHLELHHLDSHEFKFISTLTPRSPISCLEWSRHGEGFLAAGSKRGTVSFWKKSDLLNDPTRAFLREEKILDGVAVTTIQYCPSKQNLLAVGASDVFILNMDGMGKQDPSQYIYKLGNNASEGVALAGFSWNPQVQYILAAASMNGVATVWDLRQNRTLFNVCDQTYLNKSACSSLIWNPEIPTQFIMAYDDAKNPALQIWDLRRHDVPVKEFKNHHKDGVTSTAWCPHDSGLFASSDRAGFSVVWDFKRGESLSIIDHNLGASPNSLKWVPDKPGLLAISGENGNIEVRSIYDTGVSTADEKIHGNSDEPKKDNKKQGFNSYHAPKWLLRKAGNALSFKDKLAVFSQNSNNLHISSLNFKNKELQSSCELLHKLYTEENWKEICKYFTTNFQLSEHERLQWEIIASKFSKDSNGLLALLGINRKDVIQETEIFTGKKRENLEEKNTKRKESFHEQVSFAELSALDAENFFNKAGASHVVEKQPSPTRRQAEIDFSRVITETISRNINWNEAGEKLIKENLIVKNLESSIDCALMCGRSAEALIIAEQGGPDLFRRTKNAVINFSKDIFLKTTFLALLNGKTEEIVQSCELNKWKEALAILICHAGDNIGELALLLSSRLEDQNMLQPAYACMAVAGDFDRLVRAWLQQASTVIAQDRKKYASQVQYLFFKTSALAATIKRTDNKMLENIQYEYLQLLWSSGLYEETEEIIRKLPPMRHSMNLLVLIDRISRNANGNSRVPWTVVNVVPVSGGRRKTNEQSAPKTKETKHEAFPVPVSNKNSDFPKDLSKQTLSAPPAMSKNTVPPPPPRNQPFNEIKTSPFGNKSASTFPGSGEELPPHSNLAHDVQRIDVPPPPNVKQQIAPPMVRQTPPPLNMSNPVSHKEPEQMPRPPVFNQPHFDQQHAEPARPAVQVPIPHTVPPVRPPAPRATPGFKAPVKEIRAEGIDISGVPSQYHEIVMTWVKATQLPSIASTPRVLKDVEVKIQELVNKLKDLQFNDATLRLIEQMTSAFEAGDWKASLNAHLALTNTSWNENGNWLMAAKRLIQAAQAKQ